MQTDEDGSDGNFRDLTDHLTATNGNREMKEKGREIVYKKFVRKAMEYVDEGSA